MSDTLLAISCIVIDVVFIITILKYKPNALSFLYISAFIVLLSDYADKILNTHFFYITAPFFIVAGTYVYIKEKKKSGDELHE